MIQNAFADTPLKAVVCHEGSYAARWAAEQGLEAVVIREDDREILPDDLLRIEAQAFRGTSVAYVVVPEGCRSIGENAFADCEALRVIELPDSLTDIAPNAFSGCRNFVIRASMGSEAAKWAEKNDVLVWLQP